MELPEAWLVTAGEPPAVEVLGIFDAGISSEQMKLIIDVMYRLKYLSISDQFSYIVEEKSTKTGYLWLNDGTEFAEVVANGISRGIYARRSYNLRISTDNSGGKHITWQEKQVERLWNNDTKIFEDNMWYETLSLPLR